MDAAYTYVATAGLNVDVAILVDPLSIFMCLVVSGVSFLIHVYSVAYMSGDRGYTRFFAYLNFFVFSMLLLVLAANFLLLVAAVVAVVLARRRRGLEDEGTGPMRSRDEPPPTETLEVRV